MIDNGAKDTPTSGFIDCTGHFGGLCRDDDTFTVVPETRTHTRITYLSGPWTAALGWEWIDELDNHIDVFNEVVGTNFASELDKAGARHYFELSARYRIGNSIEVYGGVTNLFDQSPPLLGFGATQANTAPQLYDVFGRRLFLGFTYRSR
jgi:outer membrane receptor protein involved in Fe transport